MSRADIGTQLQEIAVKLSIQVAELLSVSSRSLDYEKQQKINEMIETNLPEVICNTLVKTTALHSQEGIDHLRSNLADYSEQFARMFLRAD